jgi:hypothetical protein
MTGRLLLRGMIAGLIAGFIAFGFARAFGEPEVDRAIAYEEQLSAAANEPAEPELVSRDTQAGIGLFTGIITYSAAMGGIFSLVFAFSYGRVGAISPRGLAGLIGIAAFVTLIVAPDLKYPGNPPAANSAETIGVRTQLFFVMIIASVAGAALAIALGRNLLSRFGVWNAWIIAGVAYLAFIAVVQMLLPAINETPENFSAVNMWNFRMAERLLVKSGNYRTASPAR